MTGAGGAPSARRRPAILLAMVAVGYVAVQLILVDPRMVLSMDEAVYASQFSTVLSHIEIAPHRSLGEALLVAPVTMVTASPVAIRVYLTALSGALLFLVFWPWLNLRPAWVGLRSSHQQWAAPVAAALYATGWAALFYGGAVLPNAPTAMCAVAVTGLFLRVATRSAGRGRPAAGGLFAAVAGLTLLRPTDAVWIVSPVLVAALVKRSWRSLAALAAMAGGLVAGWGEWAIEAYLRFGGPLARLKQVNEAAGGDGPYFLLVRQLQAVGGRVACSPDQAGCGPIRPSAVLLWAGGLLLVGCGVYSVRRASHGSVILLVVVQAAAIAMPYLLLTDWVVPRYLLPVYALLSLPAAAGLIWIAGQARVSTPGMVLAGCAGFGLLAHVGLQLDTARRIGDGSAANRSVNVDMARELTRLDVGRPCVILGGQAPEVAYLSRCRAHDIPEGIEPRSPAVTQREIRTLLQRGTRVVVLAETSARLPTVIDTSWTVIQINGDPRRVFISPRPVPR